MSIITSQSVFTHPKQVSPSGYFDDPDRAVKEDALATSLHDSGYKEPATHDDGNSGPKRGTPDNHDWNLRYSHLKSYTDKTLNEKNAVIADLQKQLDAAKRSAPLPKTDEEVLAWKEQYPDLFDIFRTLILKEAPNVTDEIKAQIAELNKSREDARKEAAQTKVLAKHPDAFDLIKDEDFVAWYNKQTKGIQNLLNSPDAEDVISVFDFYKKENGTVETKTSNKDASRAVKTGSKSAPSRSQGKIWSESEINGMDGRQWAAVEAEVEQAIKDGRFIYDISKKN